MTTSKQIHIFATRSDLESRLRCFEAEVSVKYVRCELYQGPTFEQYLSLLDWSSLGKNATGDHMTGAQFLVVRSNYSITVREILQRHVTSGTIPALKHALVVDEEGKISKIPVPLDQYLDSLKQQGLGQNKISADPTSPPSIETIRYEVSQHGNPDSITFLPGGLFDTQKVLVCGHIGTASKSSDSLSLYKTIVKSITKDFVQIGNYRVGPEAERLMDQGYRMVTIGIGSPREYDLRR
ncbi:MAG TPA: hypothetical protein VGR58_14725 [Candidatus Acidoferrum sp.]|nr:hypothetical protein [Candidatus Acidoferrum sp.]